MQRAVTLEGEKKLTWLPADFIIFFGEAKMRAQGYTQAWDEGLGGEPSYRSQDETSGVKTHLDTALALGLLLLVSWLPSPTQGPTSPSRNAPQ